MRFSLELSGKANGLRNAIGASAIQLFVIQNFTKAERESLTAQLASTRQLLLSQQSELSARESESQKLRAKLARAEMAKAEREARAREEHEMAEAGWDKLKAGLEREKDQLEQELARERAELAKQRAKVGCQWGETLNAFQKHKMAKKLFSPNRHISQSFPTLVGQSTPKQL